MISIILMFQEGKVAITKVANLLLCICSKENVGFGMLKAKVIKRNIQGNHTYGTYIIFASDLTRL